MADSTRQFDRRATLRVEEMEVTALRIDFEVVKTPGKDPNTCRIAVYNLEQSRRKALGKRKSSRTQLLVGYAGDESQIFVGDMRTATSVKDGPNFITTLETGDGESRIRTARINKSFARVTFSQMLNELAGELGVGVGNASDLAAQGKFQGAIQSLTKGTLLNGRVVDVINRMARSSGYEWSIQDGQLQFLEVGKALQTSAVSLTSTTGLIGSPELGEDGVVTARCHLQPALAPGKKVHIQSKHVEGFFKALKVTHRGDTRGQDWSTTFEAKPL